MVKIITDSAADFEPWELEKQDIACIPLTVIFGDREYQENVNLSKEQFYDLLDREEGAPKTAQASPAVVGELFQQARQKGEEAVYITLSAALSGTYQGACMAREMAGKTGIYVVDSKNATGGQRLLVEYAVRLRDEGKPASEIAAGVEALRDRIVLYACIDTLEYLYHGGRISHTAYKIGTLAQVKPIIRVSREGKVEVPSKAMGMRKGMDYLCKCLEQRRPDPEHPLYVMYTANRDNARVLAQRIEKMGYSIPEDRLIPVGAAIGSHIGPNGCGIVYVGEC